MSSDRNRIATALLATAFVGLVAVEYPTAIPALTLAAGVFMAAAVFLKL
ncbi:hypothetical protein KVH15_37650 [Streptomyces olivaceus]|nr:hypothetical protein [Streptomyces olivaceus]MBZ6086687.1 hypothetical protein [Streptomyces olivaceus]MBZ6296104.1 hypothetical protein [Streptomyces olivaceus]